MIQSTAVTNTHTRTSLNSSKSNQYILLYNNSKISKNEINSSLRIIIFLKVVFIGEKKWKEKKRMLSLILIENDIIH